MILGIAADGRVDFCAGHAEDMCARSLEELLGCRIGVRTGARLRLEVEPVDGSATVPGGSWSDVPLDTELEADFVCADGTARAVTVRFARRHTGDRQPQPAYVVVLGEVDGRMADIMATASHELRTPVTSILGYSELLRSIPGGVPAATMHQLLGRIDRNARRLKGLVEDMLTMSQVEAGGFRLEREDLDLREPLGRALEEVSTLLPVRELELRTELAESAVMVVGDPDRLERAFAQLLDNAVKFSHVGEAIDVSLAVDGADAVVTVTDRGIGIEQAELRRVFEQFYRGLGARELVTQGSGLGLAVTEAVVAGHGGRVEVESTPGVGSSFTVRLPLAGAAPQERPGGLTEGVR